MQTSPESFPVFLHLSAGDSVGEGGGEAGADGRRGFPETSPEFLSGEVLEIPALCAILYTVKQNI